MNNKLIWLDPIVEEWRIAVAQQRSPHAVMLIGPPGVGKRSLAAWMAAFKLNGNDSSFPEMPYAPAPRPDLSWIAPEDGKHSIGIEQIRSLVRSFGLTSYEGNGKVGVVEPANSMTVNAANSLLKTLEEPAGDALLILVADRVGKLPATIFSRCQRIDCRVPNDAEALKWLDRQQPGAKWDIALKMAGGAPLKAIEQLEQLDSSQSLSRDINTLGQGKGSAVEVAARWAKMDPVFVLNWLAQQVKLATLSQFAGADTAIGLSIDDSVLRRMDRRNLFCYLDIINRLRSQALGSYNVQLSFEGLLIDWADRLQSCELQPSAKSMELMRLR